jgi:hypothetical protein
MTKKNNKFELKVSDFFEEVNHYFPEAIDQMNFMDEDGDLPYLRMSAFASYTYDLYSNKNIKQFLSVLEFVENKIQMADDELFNMIGVCFVEDIVFDLAKSDRGKIIKYLPQNMTGMYRSLMPIFEKENVKSKSNFKSIFSKFLWRI